MADLPGAIHLVAETPKVNIVGIGSAMLHSKIAVISTGRQIAVFHKVSGGICTSSPQIDRHHRFCSHLTAPAHKLIQSELIGFDRTPGEFWTARTGLLGAYGVLPTES